MSKRPRSDTQNDGAQGEDEHALDHVNCYPYASDACHAGVIQNPPKFPENGMTARLAGTMVCDRHDLDFSEKLNTSSYVNVVFEPEEQACADLGMKINLADQTVYPESFVSALAYTAQLYRSTVAAENA